VTGINTHIGSTTPNRAIDQFDAIRSAAPKSEIALRWTQARFSLGHRFPFSFELATIDPSRSRIPVSNRKWSC
jgi:hypothetical protein